MIHKALLAVATLVLFLSAPVLAQSCDGCTGHGGQDADDDPDCGSISISVLVTSGECLWYINTETGLIECKMRRKCLVSITRGWNGVPANTDMGFCVTKNGQTKCQEPPPSSGSGTGSDTNTWQLSCGDSYFWSINIECPAPGTGLFAGVEGECTACL